MRCTNDLIKWFSAFFFSSRRNSFEKWNSKYKTDKIRAGWGFTTMPSHLLLTQDISHRRPLWHQTLNSGQNLKTCDWCRFSKLEILSFLIQPFFLKIICKDPKLLWLETFYLLSNERDWQKRERNVVVWMSLSVTLCEQMVTNVMVFCIPHSPSLNIYGSKRG